MRPEVESYVGNYVRAIHDFHTDLAGEVSLRKGDIFKVTKAIDKNWLHGINKEKEGNFPTDFVEKLQLPLTERDQKVFAASENFPAQQDGDLGFSKGDIILGLAPIDEFWWRGQCGQLQGIFPITHVIELEISKLLKSRSKSVHSTEQLFAQALVDSVGQLDDELSFQVGDIITVTEVIDEDWYQGECHGKSGMFLAACVRLLNEEECNASPEVTRNKECLKNKQTMETQSIKNESFSQYSQSQSSVKSNDQGQYKTDDQSSSNEHIDRNMAFNSENTKAHNGLDSGVTPYARTLFPFVGELSDELNFEANDIVTLIQHVDEQWIEGEIDGKIGLFPANYVEIVVDCPYAYKTDDSDMDIAEPYVNAIDTVADHDKSVDAVKRKSVEMTAVEKDETLVEEQYGLLLYDFNAETTQDLSVREGETVTVIKQIDENWLLVRNDEGHSGTCPLTYVDIIGAQPGLLSSSHDNNYNEINGKSSEQSAGVNKKSEIVSALSKSEEFDRVSVDVTVNSSDKNNEASAIPMLPKSNTNVGPTVSSMKSTINSKPGLKPKPILAPKPTLKPKPLANAKPWANTGHKPVTFDPNTASIPKSTSSTSLSQSAQGSEADAQTGSIPKTQSMFEINNQPDIEPVHDTSLSECQGGYSGSMFDIGNKPDTDCGETSLSASKGSNSGSTNSLVERRNSTDSHSKKTFKDWDLSKPLDTILHDEFSKAQHEAVVRSRTSSLRSSAHGHDTDSKGVDETDHSFVKNALHLGNYSRENFNEGLSVGNSTFFLTDNLNEQKRGPVRKPPPPPLGRGANWNSDFTRRPSLKKPAPPRPAGPRIAPAPSKIPLIPTRTVPPKTLSNRSSVDGEMIPVRPPGVRIKHGRPAPPRPEATRLKSPADNLMGFSPPANTALYVGEAEEDSEAVQELRTRIKHLETDIQDFEKSRTELLQMQGNLDDNEDSEIHDNIQFYDDNLKGFREELSTLKEQLALESPRERDKLDEEKRTAERKIMEERAREEKKRKMEEQKEERIEKRTRVIDELIQTEKEFITSLSLIIETFKGPTSEKHRDVDIELLCGNVEEVAEVSQKLLTNLESATNGKDFSQQVIGTCFVCLAEDMKNVYAPYCRNHDDVITLIEKYSQNADIRAYLERLLDKLREKHVVFDLEALLIKPVQRILKYPLLLNELNKTTEDDHPDKKEVMLAIKAMTNVATAINEYKRRKDLVYKYKKDTDVSIGDKLSKLSLHSIKKKSSRIKERFSANLGFIEQTRDPEFDREESRYRHLEKTVRVFIRDVQQYLEEIQNVVSCQESLAADIEDFYAEKRDVPEVQKYQNFQNQIHITFLPNFQVEVDELVVLPLNQMSQMFEGPNKVIQKRYDKLLDYDNLKRKSQSDKVFEKPMQLAKQNYEALNAQLLDELPKMYNLATQLLRDCVGSFVRAQKTFSDKTVQEMYSVLDLGMLNEENIIEEYNIQHTTVVDKLAMLCFMPKSFSPRVADQKQEKKNKRMSVDPNLLRSTEAVPQIDSQKVYVTQQFSPSKLFRVTETHVAMDSLDITVCEGDVVGVIVEKDPMGNKERWFVDNGASKGFIPKRILIPYEASPPRPLSGTSQLLQPVPVRGSVSPSSQRSSHPTSPSTFNTGYLPSQPEVDEMDFALEEEMMPELGDVNEGYLHDDAHTTDINWKSGGMPEEEEIEPRLPALYYAEYAFAARNDNEVTLFEHQVVTVIAMHDQEGNPEWWYVEADGHYGYAPSTYLRKMDSHGDPT